MRLPALDRLNGILKRVSRSFYLSLAILPQSLRAPVGLAYLLARAADTIADTALIDATERLRYLQQFRTLFQAYDATVLSDIRAALVGPQRLPAERELLASLEQCFAVYHRCDAADRFLIRELLLTLTHGMILDLTRFPRERGEPVVALKTREELDQYVYEVAGCVGEFWTAMHIAHHSSLAGWDSTTMKRRGVRFGKGLQLTNILRDLPHDLRMGRCYIPLEDLARHGLEPADLLDPRAMARVRPIVAELLALTLDHYAAGWAYTLAIPRREIRLRLACAWPLLIGWRTLELIARAENLLDPRLTLKISRRTVYRLLIGSAVLVFSNRALNWYAGSRGRSVFG